MYTLTKLTKSIFIAALLMLSGIANASIIPSLVIDFRDTAWGAANGELNYSVNDVTARATHIGESNTGRLYQDSQDGLGIQGGCVDAVDEKDEIDDCERLKVTITDHIISGIWITDLFGEDDDSGFGAEQGRLRFNTYTDSSWNAMNFNGMYSDQTNGELWVDLGGEFAIQEVQFWVHSAYRDGTEFSVAGFTVVPEPMPLVLMGLTILGIGLLRRR